MWKKEGVCLSEQYDLRKSEKGIGQLYPILEDKDGDVIDGFHREEADKNWKRMRLEHIDTEEKKLVARLVANFHRRQVTREEKQEWINGLAEIYKKQGLKVRRGIKTEKGGYRLNEITQKIVEVTGLEITTVRDYISPAYKQTESAHKMQETRVPASQVIEKAFRQRDYGKRLVERHREEVLAEEKPKIEREVKAKLVRDREFQREVLEEISKPQTVKPSDPCPSGVCELPPIMDGGEPLDVVGERLELFWKNNPECKCKDCKHYGECGVIR